ncbi:hypothetical protein [Bacillus cereus]|uniref:hypothetical protein n=1 Tax=Bacillus cereus TaxID=1396 RepID=UPI003EE3AE0A
MTKKQIKATVKLDYFTTGGDMTFDYITEKWSKKPKVKETLLEITCHISHLDTVIHLLDDFDLSLSECPTEEKKEEIIIYSDVFTKYEPQKYKAFKNALKKLEPFTQGSEKHENNRSSHD